MSRVPITLSHWFGSLHILHTFGFWSRVHGSNERVTGLITC